MNALFFEDLGGLDAFPCGGELDEDALAGDTGFLVLRDDVAGGRNGLFSVVGEACIDLCGDAAGDDFEDLDAESNGQSLEGCGGNLLVGGVGASVFFLLENIVHDGLILRHLGGGGDERGIGGRILRLILFDRVDVAGVGDYGGHATKLFE